MKIKQFILGLALIITLFAQPIMVETVEAKQLTPATVTTEMKELTPAQKIEVKLEVRKPEKTFKVKPVVVNGVSYVSVKDLEKHLGVKWKYHKSTNGLELWTPVSFIVIDDSDRYPQVNRAYIPTQNRIKIFSGVPHVPAKFVLENTNSSVAYDQKSNILNVNYYGKPEPKLVDTQMNVIKGRVLNKNGKPVKGAKVNFTTFNKNGAIISATEEKRPNFPVEVITDENGYYKFTPLDTNAHPCIALNVEYELNGVKYFGGTSGTFDYEKGGLQDGYLRISSKTETMPTIYTCINNWD